MKFPRTTQLFTGQFPLAAFASVLFVVVVFLVFNTALVLTPGVRLDLPASGLTTTPTHPTVTLALDRSGLIFYEHQAIDRTNLLSQLTAVVRDARGPLSLVIQIDRSATYESILPLASLAREAGFREVVWATRPGPIQTAGAPPAVPSAPSRPTQPGPSNPAAGPAARP